MDSQTAQPTVRTYLVAEVKCYLCGTSSGSIESEQRSFPRNVTLHPAGEQQTRTVQDWRQLRCVRCGGPTYLDEATVVERREEPANWLDDRPRRGRPPKRVVEQRRREQSQLGGSSAA